MHGFNYTKSIQCLHITGHVLINIRTNNIPEPLIQMMLRKEKRSHFFHSSLSSGVCADTFHTSIEGNFEGYISILKCF